MSPHRRAKKQSLALIRLPSPDKSGRAMTKDEFMQKQIKIFLDDYLGTKNYELVRLTKGGSDRSFFRVSLQHETSFVFMRYGDEVAENAYWADINSFMSSLDITVPRIIARNDREHFILMEDLGDTDLCSQRFALWEKRRDYYLSALTQIYRLHSFDLKSFSPNLQLSESYGPRLYKWEHDYFLENLVFAVCKIKLSAAESAKLNKELAALSKRLQKIEQSLIHRDFQSQNIMIKNDKPVMIDFQGMRIGNLFYDLGSLICDPYVTFSDEERKDLMDFYYNLISSSYSHNEFVSNFWEAAAQRLMQALGAYGFLGLKKGKKDFLGHIGNGLKNLEAASKAAQLTILEELAHKCTDKLATKNY